MSEDMAKIFEISLNKIEHSKSWNGYGKSNRLHRTLLVNTVINRVRNSDRTLEDITELQTHLNYRDPKNIDIEDYDTEKILSYTECQTRSRSRVNTNAPKKKTSSLVTLLNSRSMYGKVDDLLTKRLAKLDNHDEKENSTSNFDCNNFTNDSLSPHLLHEKRRIGSTVDTDVQPCPTKKLRSIWPCNVSPCPQDMNYSISGLASLFGDMVANSDLEQSNMSMKSNYATAMVAC